ncbi:MAG TPA: hypothetical protein P5567_08435 [Kiritimatiellia bacterium]|nr:hypothetical protein [Kiritimatiellia bacterium]HRZ12468.1 hypothetical protein [Kiritimatiellia bacterium]HSA17774.1 hypothetical protein [Kiritimatiellia bacterium]
MKMWKLLTGHPWIWTSLFILFAVVHVSLALAIVSDGKRLGARGSGTFLVGPWIWGMATLMGGVYAAGIYWIIHYSRLKPASRGMAQHGQCGPVD